MTLENEDYVVCPICQRQMKDISSHCLRVHKLTKENINKIHPNCQLVCNEVKRRRYKGTEAFVKISKELGPKIKNKNIEKYNVNPKKCLQCNKIFEYSQRKLKFCNHHCSASYTNQKRIENGWKMSEEAKRKIKLTLANNPNAQVKWYTNRKTDIKCIICQICNKKKFVAINKKSKTCGNKDCIDKFFILIGQKLSQRNGNKNMWKPINYNSKYYGEISMDSSWEVELAQSLENNNIQWVKPKFFEWIDESGKQRKYFPDFYLPHYDVYLDPKNPYLAKLDKYKTDQIIEVHKIKLFVLDKKSLLNWEYVKTLI